MSRADERAVLVIDGEAAQARLVAAIATRAGWRARIASDVDGALALLAEPHEPPFAAIIVDSTDPEHEGVDMIAQLHELAPRLPVLLVTAQSSVANAVAAMRAGAMDFLVKPIAPHRLIAALDAATGTAGGELRPMAEKLAHPLPFDEIVGSAPDFRAALAIAAKAARARVPVLIEGEIGVGKEVIAQAIHAASSRAKRPLFVVNCGAIARNQIESELFGHERGAFTGAFDRHVGKLAQADGGTIFLDEVGELPIEAQAKLLRLVQTGEVQPLGSRSPQEIDVRIIAASNRTLLEEVAAGRFREDLYYRVAVVQFTLPPLRERAGDIPALARHLLGRIAQQPGMRSLGITDDALSLLMSYRWPGNVRQLQNALFRAAVLCDGSALTAQDFPEIAREAANPVQATPSAGNNSALAGAPGITLYQANGHLRPLDAIEADVIRLAIGHYQGRMSEVARRLGIGRSTLYRKLGELGMDSAA
ncbi:MAG: sigma-54-dependent Fis family transcriptional regulator [Sphingomonadaceae bacterium]|nr:sigma-54-dependent Fis family transcriptional regulator [Sphingomonadaceae bacterium]